MTAALRGAGFMPLLCSLPGLHTASTSVLLLLSGSQPHAGPTPPPHLLTAPVLVHAVAGAEQSQAGPIF